MTRYCYDSQAMAHPSVCVCQSKTRTLWIQNYPVVLCRPLPRQLVGLSDNFQSLPVFVLIFIAVVIRFFD